MRLKTANVGYSIPGFGTALPGSPNDGDLFILVDNVTTPTYSWMVRYVAAKASNKWVFIGGAPARSFVQTNETTSSTSFTALATAGPSVTVPVAGDYLVEWGSWVYPNSADDINSNGFHGYDVGGTGAVDTTAIIFLSTIIEGGTNSNRSGGTGASQRVHTGLAASTALVSKYRVTGNTWNFQQRWMHVTPIAIGG